MKTILNYQQFSLQAMKGFLNVETKEQLKAWKRLLVQYHYLHSLGVKISKANRKFVFATLNKIQESETALLKLIDEGATDEAKADLKEVIEEQAKLLIELSEIRDEIVVEQTEPKTKFITMMFFETSADGIYKTKRGRKFVVKNTTREEQHTAFIKKYLDAIEERKKIEKKALKAEQKTMEKANTFVEKVFEKKNLNK